MEGAEGSLALTAYRDQLLLAFVKGNGQLCWALRGTDGLWTPEAQIGQDVAGDVVISSYMDYADRQEKVMLCWRSANGFLRYLTFADGVWQSQAGSVGQLTDGPMALAQMGPSLYLVYKERNTRKLRMTSYNLAPFNGFDASAFNDSPAPENNTSLHRWAPADFYVGHFARNLAALQNDYQALGYLAMASIEGEMHLVHRAAYQDTPSAYTEVFGLTGIFTASNEMTNGFGTLSQAGWTREQELPSIKLDPQGGIALSSKGEELVLVWQRSGSSELDYCKGGYSPIGSS